MKTIIKSVILSLIIICTLIVLNVYMNDMRANTQNLDDGDPLNLTIDRAVLNSEIDKRIKKYNKTNTRAVLLNTVNGAIKGTIIGTITTGTPTGAIITAIMLGTLGGIETGVTKN